MSDNLEVSTEASAVICDICVGVKTPALKTCLKCEVSMCREHLQTHLTSQVLLQTHPLTKPVPPASCGQEVCRCLVHGKVLEYYCLDDRVLVCVSCAIEEGHRLHNMKTLQTAYKELTDNLRVKVEGLAERQKQSKDLESWFKDQRQTLEKCVSQLKKSGSAMGDLVLTNVKTSVSARLGALQAAQQAISSALNEEDEFVFLQKFANVHKSLEEACKVDLREGLESVTDRNKLIEEIRKHGQIVEEQVLGLMTKLLAFVDPENQQDPKYQKNPFSELTFEPKTLGPGMTLSEDQKTVFYSPETTNLTQLTKLSTTLQQTLNNSQNRGITNPQLAELSRLIQETQTCSTATHLTQTFRCQQTSTTGSLRWIVLLSERFDWTIGLCDENGTRENYSKVHGLKIQEETLTSIQTKYYTNDEMSDFSAHSACTYTEKHPVLKNVHFTYPWKVEVIWDYSTRLLTFYSRNKQTKGFLLLKLEINSPYDKLFPFVTMEPKTGDPKNKAFENKLMSKVNCTSYTEILCRISKK